MKRTVLLGSLLCGIAFLSLASQGDSLNPGDTRYVDITEVLRNYEKGKKEQESFQRSFAPQVAELKRREEDLMKKQKELAPLDRNSAEFLQKSNELKYERQKIQDDGDLIMREGSRKNAEMTLGHYGDVRAAVKKFAESNKLRAVISVQKDQPSDSEDDLQDRIKRSNQRQVLYFDPSLDVTAQIIKILNTQ